MAFTKEEHRAYRERNKERLNQWSRDYYAERKSDPEFMAMKRNASRWARRKAKYGLTREAYAAMVEAQGGLCAICGRQPDHDLRVDHDHTTGNVRALLCSNCNSAIGLFYEDTGSMAAAIEYLERHREE